MVQLQELEGVGANILGLMLGTFPWELQSVGRLPISSQAGKMDEAFIPQW